MSSSHILVSLDWGGTKVAGIVLDRRAGRVKRFSVSAVNLRLASDDRLREILRQVGEVSEVSRVAGNVWWGIGAAGGRPGPDTERLMSALTQVMGTPPEGVNLWNDAQTGFAAAFGGNDGILSINGTGCILWGRRCELENRRGGWGYLLDESPSGGYFGTLAARGVLAAWEGDGETTRLAENYARICCDWPQDRAGLLTDLYSHPSIQNRIAGLAPLFTAAVDEESAWARYFLNQSLKNWVREMKSLKRHLKFSPQDQVRVVGAGDLWQGWPRFRTLAGQALEQTWPGEFALREPMLTPEWGPLVLARNDLGYAMADFMVLNDQQEEFSA